MTITLELSPELEQRLSAAAQRVGNSLETYMLRLLERATPPENMGTKKATLPQPWIEEETLADFLAEHIGIIHSSEYIPA